VHLLFTLKYTKVPQQGSHSEVHETVAHLRSCHYAAPAICISCCTSCCSLLLLLLLLRLQLLHAALLAQHSCHAASTSYFSIRVSAAICFCLALLLKHTGVRALVLIICSAHRSHDSHAHGVQVQEEACS
jgi:hypothetical protein